MSSIIGWDIGGVNIKATRLTADRGLVTGLEPFELQRAPERLAPTLATVAASLGATGDERHAVTMTAELSQFFRSKRDGVDFVLTALSTVFPSDRVHVFGTDAQFHSVDDSRRNPLRTAAANWLATACLVAQDVPTCLLVDTGSTTTDVIPLVGGSVAASGRTDPERLATGELVYTGALRTPTEAVARRVPLHRADVGVSAEGFAIMGDVHVWLGALAPEDYTVPSPDGRPATRTFAGERLARVVCADREMLSDGDIDGIAGALSEAQIATVAEAVAQVRSRHPQIETAVVTGLGDFVAAAAARRVGLAVTRLADRLGAAAARTAAAAAVAILLEQGS